MKIKGRAETKKDLNEMKYYEVPPGHVFRDVGDNELYIMGSDGDTSIRLHDGALCDDIEAGNESLVLLVDGEFVETKVFPIEDLKDEELKDFATHQRELLDKNIARQAKEAKKTWEDSEVAYAKEAAKKARKRVRARNAKRK